MGTDVYGYSLHYFTGDYKQIGSGGNVFLASQTGSDLVNSLNSLDLYNGNIARMVTTITNPSTRAALPLGNAYKYDQLNRLRQAKSFTNLNATTNAWGTGGTAYYLNELTYDANGNIETQRRHDESGLLVDLLTYKYNAAVSGKKSNRLYHVWDGQPNNAAYTDDIDDQDVAGSLYNPTTLANANYTYDKEGRLIADKQEEIATIVWRVDGKVKEIIRPIGSTRKNLKFDYDAMGNRIAKHVTSSAGALEKSTYYVLDASGNVMSVYERKPDGFTTSLSYQQTERHTYGSSRLGVMKASVNLLGSVATAYSMKSVEHKIGERTYELSNHLGNVLTVISDKPLPYANGTVGGAGVINTFWQADIRVAQGSVSNYQVAHSNNMM